MTSARRGTFSRINVSSVSRLAIMSGNVAFLAPEIGIVPLRRCPPTMRIRSMLARLLTCGSLSVPQSVAPRPRPSNLLRLALLRRNCCESQAPATAHFSKADHYVDLNFVLLEHRVPAARRGRVLALCAGEDFRAMPTPNARCGFHFSWFRCSCYFGSWAHYPPRSVPCKAGRPLAPTGGIMAVSAAFAPCRGFVRVSLP